jgi:hypothetical protein
VARGTATYLVALPPAEGPLIASPRPAAHAPAQTQLRGVASRLRRGAEALRLHCRREELFYGQLVALLRFWKVRLGPLGSDAPFYVDLALGNGGGGGGGGGAGGTAGGGAAGGGPSAARVDIIRDAEGQLRVQVRGAGARRACCAPATRHAPAGTASGAAPHPLQSSRGWRRPGTLPRSPPPAAGRAPLGPRAHSGVGAAHGQRGGGG